MVVALATIPTSVAYSTIIGQLTTTTTSSPLTTPARTHTVYSSCFITYSLIPSCHDILSCNSSYASDITLLTQQQVYSQHLSTQPTHHNILSRHSLMQSYLHYTTNRSITNVRHLVQCYHRPGSSLCGWRTWNDRRRCWCGGTAIGRTCQGMPSQ